MLLFREEQDYNSQINELRMLLDSKESEINNLKNYIRSLEEELSKHIDLQNRLTKVIYVS